MNFPAWVQASVIISCLGMAGAANADDVRLVSREGNIAVSGQLQSYDGEFYRLKSDYGLLVVDGQGVICDGPACPDLIAPKAVIRIVGAPEPGLELLPRLFQTFAKSRDFIYEPIPGGASQQWRANIRAPQDRKLLAEISFAAMTAQDAQQALIDGEAEFIFSAQVGSTGAVPVAIEAVVAIASPDNPTSHISTVALAQVLSGKFENWRDLGGPDMPIVLHGLTESSDMALALQKKLGKWRSPNVVHETIAALAEAVRRDPWALALTGQTAVGEAKVLVLQDGCGYDLNPSALWVKAADYPLTVPIFLKKPSRRLPLFAREFLDFLPLPAAETAVAEAGYIDRTLTQMPLRDDAARVFQAVKQAGSGVDLGDLQAVVEVMSRASRLSFSFRFEDGTDLLDVTSMENIEQLARLIAAERFPYQRLVLAGFSDRRGDAAQNKELSQRRGEVVLKALLTALPNMKPEYMPKIMAFGEVLPIACDDTRTGQRLNQRVELWSLPSADL